MNIKQFSGKYLQNDDRIIFRFNTIDQSEYIFWFTRRITQFILISAAPFIEKEYENRTPSIENVISEMKQSDKQAPSFNQAYAPGHQYPLGGEAVLVMDAKCEIMKIEEQYIFSLDFILPGGAGVNLKLPISIMKPMILLLEELNVQAKWGHPTK